MVLEVYDTSLNYFFEKYYGKHNRLVKLMALYLSQLKQQFMSKLSNQSQLHV